MADAARVIPVESRDQSGTGNARALRRAGKIPGVVYGGGNDPESIAIDPREVMKGLNKVGFYAKVVELEIGKKKQQVLPKAVQFHPVSDDPLHIDFLRVANDTEVTVTVPVKLLNIEKCRGLKSGGSLNTVRSSVGVVCRAGNIPEGFEIDILEYKIGDAVKSSAIDLPEGARFDIDDREFTIATIAKPRGGSANVLDDEDGEGEEGEDGAETAEGGEE